MDQFGAGACPVTAPRQGVPAVVGHLAVIPFHETDHRSMEDVDCGDDEHLVDNLPTVVACYNSKTPTHEDAEQ